MFLHHKKEENPQKKAALSKPTEKIGNIKYKRKNAIKYGSKEMAGQKKISLAKFVIFYGMSLNKKVFLS